MTASLEKPKKKDIGKSWIRETCSSWVTKVTLREKKWKVDNEIHAYSCWSKNFSDNSSIAPTCNYPRPKHKEDDRNIEAKKDSEWWAVLHEAEAVDP